MPKSLEEREALIEAVETAMLRGANRIVDVLNAVPQLKKRTAADFYMRAVERRWSGRGSDNEQERQRLINEKREIMRQAHAMIAESERALEEAADYKTAPERAAARTDANANKAKAMKIILEAQAGISKLLGLEVKKVEHSGSIVDERNSIIALVGADTPSHTIRDVLQGINPANQVWPAALQSEPATVALPSGESTRSA